MSQSTRYRASKTLFIWNCSSPYARSSDLRKSTPPVLNSRNELSKKLMDLTERRVKNLGLRLISVGLKDIMFPGKLKEIFAQVVSARKDELAALEKVRGETATLRSLANVAKMLEDNPNLMQPRLVQALGNSSGNTLILGMPSQSTPIPVSKNVPPKELEGEHPRESEQHH